MREYSSHPPDDQICHVEELLCTLTFSAQHLVDGGVTHTVCHSCAFKDQPDLHLHGVTPPPQLLLHKINFVKHFSDFTHVSVHSFSHSGLKWSTSAACVAGIVYLFLLMKVKFF